MASEGSKHLSVPHLEYKHVSSLRHGTHIHGVQRLIKLLGLGRPDVNYLPFEILWKVLYTFERYLELECNEYTYSI